MKRGTRQADIFSTGARRALLTLLALSSLATIVALLYGARMVSPKAGPTDSYGAGPIGHRVLAETLEAVGFHVLQNRGDDFTRASAPLFFLEPGRDARVDGRLRWLADAISARGDRGLPTLVVLPKWRFSDLGDGSVVPVSDATLADVENACFRMQGAGLSVTRRDADHPTRTHLLGTLGDFEVDVPQLMSLPEVPAGAEVLLQSEEGAVVLRAADGTLVLTEPDLLHSFNLHRADHAALLMAVLDELGGDAVVIDESFHGHGHRLRLTEALGKFPAILIVVQLMLVIVLLVAFGSRRFGPPLEGSVGRFGPQEAIAVTASVLAQGQSLAQLARHYVRAVIDDLHHGLGLPEVADRAMRADAVDAVAKLRRASVRARPLLDEVEALKDTRPSHAAAWRLARSAQRLRRELLMRPKKKDRAAPSEAAKDRREP